MGKSKKGGSSSSKAASAAPKCLCEHPFNCSCGNRPPRPSKGHKWYPETQEWAGKGHKQKGASGQTASKAEETKTTDKGKTKIAQWQSLPSTLLKDHCKREKRRPPKFKNIAKKDGTFLYRVILPDAKDSDKDLFFVPSKAVENEEQAMEEASILALLNQTPNLPHERKLPEPYKTTWIHAVDSIKESAKSGNNKNDTKKNKQDNSNNNGNPIPEAESNSKASHGNNASKGDGGAQASTSLALGRKYTSNAEKRHQMNEQRRERAKRIRHHEAVRMANKNHPVFLAAQLRQQIQKLLRGDDVPDILENEDDGERGDDLGGDEDLDDGQAYVMERLHNEGFTRRQIRTSLQSCDKGNSGSGNEDEWDKIYEDCLQWLCIHLDEDQLPEGFDPRGGTLDVIVHGKEKGQKPKTPAENTVDPGSDNTGVKVSKDVSDFASLYGISNKEAKLIADQTESQKCTREDVLWDTLKKAAGVTLDVSAVESDENLQALQEEIDALEAIFPSEFNVKNEGKATIISLKISDFDAEITMQLEVENRLYPSVWPKRVLFFGKWPSSSRFGVAIHVEIIKFMATLELGNPLIFEVYGHVQAQLHSLSSGELKPISLLPYLGAKESAAGKSNQQNVPSTKSNNQAMQANAPHKRNTLSRKVNRRPRERSTFWSTPPTKTPPATPFPKIHRSMDAARKSLPAYKARSQFLSAMAEARKGGRVVLVTGDTGCGKTTQIPQFILEEAPDDAKIVIAQPRRIAATGVANRVADERGEGQPGTESVGYIVRGDSSVNSKTRMVFCTTGVLLRQLQNDKALENISHIIIDEVHERHLDSDVLLCFLKLTLKEYPSLNVILMSATLDADRFAAYWGEDTPRIHIPGRTFPVTDYFLEDVLSLTGYIPPKKKKKKQWQGSSDNRKPKKVTPWADSEKSDEESEVDEESDTGTLGTRETSYSVTHSIPLEELVGRVDESHLDYDLLAQLVRYLVQHRSPEDDGSILVFLSGAPEINNALETFRKVLKNHSVLFLPLHGGLQPEEQRKVFQSPRNGLTKIVLSTNIAESSITIPDCTIVIDSCREKESSYDPTNRMPLLLEQFASRASLKQRRGRAGRVREGKCYKLISQKTHNKLKDFGDPEICRCALDQTLLSLLFLGVERGSGTFMNHLMDPPDQKSLDAAVFSLKKLGAITDGERANEVALTPLGMHLAGIPAPPSVGKLLVMGSILGCRQAALSMAAGMTLGRSPFLRVDAPRIRRSDDEDKYSIEDKKKEKVLEERKALFSEVGNSDHSLLVAVFQKWEGAPAGGGSRKHLCDSLGLSFTGMRDLAHLVKQYDSSLNAAGYVASNDSNRNMKSWKIIRACAVSALAPSQLVRVQRPSTKYAKTVEGAVEKDGVAKELKFFIRPTIEDHEAAPTQHNSHEERVFIHPSSFNFTVGSFPCPWLVYHTMIRTSKPFLRDVSECSAYALLLFGGEMEVRAKEGVVVIDDWVKLEAKARIGSLIGGLREKIDELLAKKIEDPSVELASTTEMKLIFKLLMTDGLP